MDYQKFFASLNSFQQWAVPYASGFGYTVKPCGNWVTLHKDGRSTEIMTEDGVRKHCDPSAKHVPD